MWGVAHGEAALGKKEEETVAGDLKDSKSRFQGPFTLWGSPGNKMYHTKLQWAVLAQSKLLSLWNSNRIPVQFYI